LGPAREQFEDKPTYEGAKNAEQHRDYATAGVATRHEQLGDDTRDETEEDPGYDSHELYLRKGPKSTSVARTIQRTLPVPLLRVSYRNVCV
jgi:hypothetical protein